MRAPDTEAGWALLFHSLRAEAAELRARADFIDAILVASDAREALERSSGPAAEAARVLLGEAERQQDAAEECYEAATTAHRLAVQLAEMPAGPVQ